MARLSVSDRKASVAASIRGGRRTSKDALERDKKGNTCEAQTKQHTGRQAPLKYLFESTESMLMTKPTEGTAPLPPKYLHPAATTHISGTIRYTECSCKGGVGGLWCITLELSRIVAAAPWRVRNTRCIPAMPDYSQSCFGKMSPAAHMRFVEPLQTVLGSTARQW
jgi:hypothetical protein